jgi:hypothetical protein
MIVDHILSYLKANAHKTSFSLRWWQHRITALEPIIVVVMIDILIAIIMIILIIAIQSHVVRRREREH